MAMKAMAPEGGDMVQKGGITIVSKYLKGNVEVVEPSKEKLKGEGEQYEDLRIIP